MNIDIQSTGFRITQIVYTDTELIYNNIIWIAFPTVPAHNKPVVSYPDRSLFGDPAIVMSNPTLASIAMMPVQPLYTLGWGMKTGEYTPI
jgi:hypothetical protein